MSETWGGGGGGGGRGAALALSCHCTREPGNNRAAFILAMSVCGESECCAPAWCGCGKGVSVCMCGACRYTFLRTRTLG